MLVLLTLVGAVLGTSPPPTTECPVTSRKAYGAAKKDPVMYEMTANAQLDNVEFRVTGPAMGFWPNTELETSNKFADRGFKAFSITIPQGSPQTAMAALGELKGQVGATVKSFGYYFPAVEGPAWRVVLVFKPFKSREYHNVLSNPSAPDVWSVEKYSDWGPPPKTEKPTWVFAKWNSKAFSDKCDSPMYARQEEDDAKDEEDIKETKMYKKFSEMTKKKLMKLMEKYKAKIAIAKKALKAKKEN